MKREIDMNEISDGNLYIKEASSASAGNWIKLSGFGLPEPVSYSYYDGTFSGEHIFKVAADKDHLYALSYAPYYNQDKSRNVPKDLYLYECTPKAGAYGLPDLPANAISPPSRYLPTHDDNIPLLMLSSLATCSIEM